MFSLKIVKGTELADGVLPETRLPMPLTRFTIGRDPANHWPIPDRTLAISARHCEIVAAPGGPVLRDLSTNGTFVNGGLARLNGDHALQDGDRIELGPYVIAVEGPAPRAPAPAPAADIVLPPAPAPRSPSVEATAPLRGGDPAAMLASGAAAAQGKVGLTEILRSAPPPEDSKLAVTKIRLAPKPVPGAAAARAPAPEPSAPAPKAVAAPPAVPVPPPPPVQAAPAVPADPLLVHLATGLGLPPQALTGRDPAQAAAQVGALARAAVTVLRQLLEQQAQGRRQIGSRSPALLPVRDVNPLRLAATPDAALAALLAPGADVEGPLQRAATELASHQDRMMAAFRAAATRLGEEIAPGSLQAALGTGGAVAPTQLWELYTQVWQGIGLAPGQPWSQGFLEAAMLHLAAAYDQAAKP